MDVGNVVFLLPVDREKGPHADEMLRQRLSVRAL